MSDSVPMLTMFACGVPHAQYTLQCLKLLHIYLLCKDYSYVLKVCMLVSKRFGCLVLCRCVVKEACEWSGGDISCCH